MEFKSDRGEERGLLMNLLVGDSISVLSEDKMREVARFRIVRVELRNQPNESVVTIQRTI